MKAKEKATELLEKINNGKISKALWDNCSDYAKKDLIRKALIVVDEVLSLGIAPNERSSSVVYRFYSEVKIEIVNFNPLY